MAVELPKHIAWFISESYFSMALSTHGGQVNKHVKPLLDLGFYLYD
jgi:hypothetical protein